MLLEQISKDDMKKYIKEYYNYAKEHLKIDKAPKLKFIEDEKNADDFLGKTGYYDPKNMTIHLFVTNRHPKDIVRSFAHELIHHYQNLNEKLPKEIMHKTQEVDYASKDMHLRDMEREAFEKGNMMFRDWTDSLKKNKSLKESKMAKVKNGKFNAKKSDLDKNGKISKYERTRGMAIANNLAEEMEDIEDMEDMEDYKKKEVSGNVEFFKLSKSNLRNVFRGTKLRVDPETFDLHTEKGFVMYAVKNSNNTFVYAFTPEGELEIYNQDDNKVERGEVKEAIGAEKEEELFQQMSPGSSMSEGLLSKRKQRKIEEQSELEATDPRFKKFFEKETRVMDEYKTKREEIVYNELMKRFLK